MKKIFNIIDAIVDHKISLKELYFSLTTWFGILVLFLGFTTKFHTTLLLANLIIALYVYLIIILITNRILFSGFSTLLLAVLFDYIKLIKWQFLMQEISAADFFMLKLLINHGLLRLIYEYATKEIYLIFILLLINFILLWNKFDTFLDKQRLGSRNFYALRMVSFGVAILLSSKLFEIAFDKKSYFHLAIESIKNESKDYPRKIYGPFADIVFTIQDIYIEPKSGKIDESLILDKIEKEKNTIITKQDEMPDVVVILNESVFDPSKLDYDFADALKFAFFQKGKYTKYSGILNVNTFGGSSWISEYEINTGISHKSFAGPSYMPFITLVPHTKNSIMSHLRSLGYRVEVLYPVDKNFSLALDAYTKLGSHEVTDIYEYGFEPESWGHIPDKMIGDMIIDALDKNPEKPKYIFAATMLNHGPHSGFFLDNIGCSRSMNDQLCSKLNDYISRLTKTNEDQMDLIEKLMKRKKKTIIVNFGDHLPSFEGFSTQLRFTRDIKDYFKTFYNVNANFDIRDDLNYPELDITFIPGLILDMAKLNNDPFYKANSLMRKNCNGQITHCKKDDDKLLESYKSLIVKQLGF
ncbi:MAG: sulfatase-like hydrolase/transferase [Rickettsiaceae bacterium]|nr:sulfatase-like hydrolase/transferase [Rickettsiaceae bacterium]